MSKQPIFSGSCPLCGTEGEFQYTLKGQPAHNLPPRIVFNCPKCNTSFYIPRKNADE